MSLRTLEAAILAELRTVTGNKKIRQKDICAWLTGDTVESQTGELTAHLPALGVTVAYTLPEVKK